MCFSGCASVLSSLSSHVRLVRCPLDHCQQLELSYPTLRSLGAYLNRRQPHPRSHISAKFSLFFSAMPSIAQSPVPFNPIQSSEDQTIGRETGFALLGLFGLFLLVLLWKILMRWWLHRPGDELLHRYASCLLPDDCISDAEACILPDVIMRMSVLNPHSSLYLGCQLIHHWSLVPAIRYLCGVVGPNRTPTCLHHLTAFQYPRCVLLLQTSPAVR